MFTGLIEEVATLRSRTVRGPGARLQIRSGLGPLVLGESIAVMGVCLTVDAILSDGFEADCSAETLQRSTLGTLAVGHKVHLERALQVGARLGGHIVAGHVDGIGWLIERKRLGEGIALRLGYASELAGFVACKGSIAVDGVSLTLNAVEPQHFEVMLVPHTQRSTILEQMPVGTRCNLEVDVLARYVARWLEAGKTAESSGAQPGSSDQALMTKLASGGFL